MAEPSDQLALLQNLERWVFAFSRQEASGEAFLAEHQHLREEVLRFGKTLEDLESLSADVPDELYVAASNLMEVLDILWDEAAGEEPELCAPAELLARTRHIFAETLPRLEEAVDRISDANSRGADL